MTVSELIRQIQKPTAIYVDEIVKAFHEDLCKKFGECESPDDCNKKENEKEKTKKPVDLCKTCNCWLKELRRFHRAGNNSSWHKNCNSSKWSEDPWEVAKFFMSNLGSSRDTVKDAESTHLSSLLNVLEWMKDKAFPEGKRVDIELVRKLSSQVRNNWAHAPKHEFVDGENSHRFPIAIKFLEDLETKFPHTANRKCLEYLKKLEKNRVMIIAESELKNLRQLQRHLNDPKNRLPNKDSEFTARESEIESVISLLIVDRTTVVSLHGGPGFGKTAIAIEVCHKLKDDHNITVIFCRLATTTTVNEMVKQLCNDVNADYENDDNAKSSLVFRLKRVRTKIILVMDDIDNQLEQDDRSSFDDFMKSLGSIDNCQMITTSRSSYRICNLSFEKVDVEEMDDKSCMELLKKKSSIQEDEVLGRLAKKCGNIPLAMCIAASQVDEYEDPEEFLHQLEKEPFETLQCPDTNQYVYRLIKLSYDRLDINLKQSCVRLAEFDGSFSKEAASVVIEKDNLATKRIQGNLVRRSLIKQEVENRYSIHLLIKHFFKNQQKGENEMAEMAREQAARAKFLMVRYYLKLTHDLTIKSYSKDEYKNSRKALRQEARNIQNVLHFCCHPDHSSPEILDCLSQSEIYTYSARFFSFFIKVIIQRSIVDEFLRRCAEIATEREQYAIKMNFDCLLADVECRKTIGKNGEDFISQMEKIEKEFKTRYEDLKQDKSLCAHYYSQYARFLLRKSRKNRKKRLELQTEAREMMEKSLKLKNALTGTKEGIADKVYALLQLGNLCKNISDSKQAQEYYEEATQLSQDHLGEHELTAACYKTQGDLFLFLGEYEIAKENYILAKEMREELGLDANERHVFLLKNLGISLTKNEQVDEAIKVLESARDKAEKLVEILESARDKAEKLVESYEPKRCKLMVYASLAFAYNTAQKNSEDAVIYARKALNFEGIENPFVKDDYKELLTIRDAGMN